MALVGYRLKLLFFSIFTLLLSIESSANDILGCGGFVKSHVKLDYSEIEIGLYTKEGSLKEKTECAPTNGYYFLPLYEKGDYVLKVHPPAGLSFEPSEVALSVDGVSDRCSTGQDINFEFNGFGINGRVITLGQEQGPSGIDVQLVNEKGDTRDTVTSVGGEFHFTAVIPGKYTVKASHPRWKLEPSQAEVQMKEGKMALPVGVVLAVKGYDVKGSVSSFGSPIDGVYVLLYSIQENPKYRVEGCNTALLQGVPDSPICHVITDASGEFSFGLVPAGEYKLLALATSPGQVEVTYNVKPDAVPFTVRHDSLYIKNAFEVTGFTVVGTVVSTPGKGMSGVRVLLDGTPAGTSDAAGRFTLPRLQPGVYTVSFQHEQCEFDEVTVSVSERGPSRGVTARAARWRVCGSVAPAPAGAARRVLLAAAAAPATSVAVDQGDGKWCTFLPPGVYTAKVEVSDREQREGLQYYPLSRSVAVGHGAVEGVAFSQLKGELSGRVECEAPACRALVVTLRPLSPDGAYVGRPLTTVAADGKYTFTEVLPGSVEISVPTERLCWAEARHNVAVTQARAAVPPFRHVGYVLRLHVSHAAEVEYSGASASGSLRAPRGASWLCVPRAERYTLTPRACHRFRPPRADVLVTADEAADAPPTVHFVAVEHAVVVKVTSPEPVTDLVLTIDRDGKSGEKVGPLASTQDGGMYVFEHTLYMADGAVAAVAATSASLLFEPAAPAQLVGVAECQAAALTLRARRALTLAGRVVPPVPGVRLTLLAEDGKQTQTTSADGTYRFGPLDASQQYSISAEKESYVFSAPDAAGDIHAHKLAEIIVELLDDADGTPLQGALVSVSGGAYRRNLVGGALRFASLSPADYYVKPHMKEYKFSPPHSIVTVEEGRTHTLTLRGTRVAWSAVGALVSLGGAGWARAALAAEPAPPAAAPCVAEDATTEPSGAFRIRGLLPGCEYGIRLKESAAPELAGLRLLRAPASLRVRDKKDITGVVVIASQPTRLTDAAVLVRTPRLDHYRTLRLTLAPAPAASASASASASAAAPLYSARIDAAGFTAQINPGLTVVLPRLAADNNTYVVTLECSLSKATHVYTEPDHYFTSDGQFKLIIFEFEPKVKSSEQELRQSSFLLIPLLGVAWLVYLQRGRAAGAWAARPRAGRPPRRADRADRPDVLDKASIDHILSTVNAAGKKPPKKRAL